MVKTAIIVGAAGQDGKLLEAHLHREGYRLACIDRGFTHCEGVAWNKQVDITSANDVLELVAELRPNEIYHLAAVHQSAEEASYDDLAFYRKSYEVNFFSLLNFLEAVRLQCKDSRVFYAASSHIFGHSLNATTCRENEASPFNPETIYAMTKASGVWACQQYRGHHQVFASVGILYNHESSLREEKFLSKKVIRAVVDIKLGLQRQLELGDLSAKVDWGFASDYVEAMHAILSADSADDFVIATGKGHTVREFVAAAFEEVGIVNWERYVVEYPNAISRRRRNGIGDPSKLMRVTNWRPKTSFLEMIRVLVRDEMQKRG